MTSLFASASARLVVALAGGFAGTFLARAFARRFGIMNAPNPIVPQHVRPVAYLGGVGVAIGVAAGFATLAWLGRPVALGFVLPAFLFLVLGLVDDLRLLSPAMKFGWQSLIAALAVAMGVRASLTGIALLDDGMSWLWIVAVVNAFNLTDVCDGLVASISVVMFTALALLDPSHAGVAGLVAASALGFLAWNRPPASIFLGDSGSHLLGFLAAALTLAVPRDLGLPLLTWCACGWILGVPLFEGSFLTLVRSRKGLPWWKGSPDHFSLRLQAAGLSRVRTDLVACAVAAAWAASGVLMTRVAAPVAVALVAAEGMSAGLFGLLLLRHEVLAPRRQADATSPEPGAFSAQGVSTPS
jgi:UDP-GlcNAc:undecaprenyl-phosphate GlcNAc-1-phosphate transferase